MQELRLTRPGRKHRLGIAHIIEAMIDAGEPVAEEGSDALLYVGKDSRGVEIEVVTVPDNRKPGRRSIIHAMPTQYRK